MRGRQSISPFGLEWGLRAAERCAYLVLLTERVIIELVFGSEQTREFCANS